MPVATMEEVEEQIRCRAPENQIEPRLDPLRRLMDVLGNPQAAYPAIHITGTNGKSSTARLIESILRAHHLGTGLMLSPLLAGECSRFLLDGVPVSEEIFTATWEDIQPYLRIVDGELERDQQPRLTGFEALTALGYAIFADAPVDVAVIEVGLGGTWDATNVIDGTVAVFTPIALDHTALLGESVGEIATEKAGIIKRDALVVTAAQEESVAQVMAARSAELGARVYVEGRDFGLGKRSLAVGGQMVDIEGLAARYADLYVPLHGEHQAHNAALATVAVEAFLGAGKKELGAQVLEEGLSSASSPARLDVVRTAPTVIVDAAHNSHGIQASIRGVHEAFDFHQLVLVVGILVEKDAAQMLVTLREGLEDVDVSLVVTEAASPRAIPAAELAERALDAGFDEDRTRPVERLDEALEWAIQLADADPELRSGVLVIGSVVLATQAWGLLRRGSGAEAH